MAQYGSCMLEHVLSFKKMYFDYSQLIPMRITSEAVMPCDPDIYRNKIGALSDFPRSRSSLNSDLFNVACPFVVCRCKSIFFILYILL